MLGRDVVRRLEELGLAHVDSDLDCDITDRDAVRAFAADRGVDWIINCAAYTAVDAAEDDEAKAEAVNAIGPANLGSEARDRHARIIQVSTDYVFDGNATTPYTEDQEPAPRGAYGRTKARGEQLLAAATPEYFIVRTAWLYGTHGKNFVATMLRLMNERDVVKVVDDQRGTPTYTRDLAVALCAFVAQDSRAFGTYHYTNDGEVTWYTFARAIYDLGHAHRRIGRACQIIPIETDQYPTKAVRPKYSVLSKLKIKQALQLDVPVWQSGLERYFSELDAEPT